MKYYKVLGRGRMSYNDGIGKWPKARTWLEASGPLVPCQNGLHLCRIGDLIMWLNEEIWEVEPAPKTEMIICEDKVVARKARLIKKISRWNAKTARLFTADCAEHVLPLYEKKYPKDERPRKAIEAARKYAHGKISKKELAAARATAWATARAAAGAAAANAAWAAAGAAAANAARATAWATARAAAGAAAANAAWAAAGAAAANAAWATAWVAAGVAAANAARDAVRVAERKWQTKRLAYYLRIRPNPSAGGKDEKGKD